jgi:segregation and condensation protein A
VGRGLGELVAAAKRRVRQLELPDIAHDRLSVAQAMVSLRAWVARLGSLLFGELPLASWGERTVFFSALLEGIKTGEWQAEQPEVFGEIHLSKSGTAATQQDGQPLS